MFKSSLRLMVVMAVTIALVGFARPAPDVSAEKASVKICRADGTPIDGFYLATVNVTVCKEFRTGADGTVELDYELVDGAKWLVVRAFHSGGVSSENSVSDTDPYAFGRRLKEIRQLVHIPGEFLIPASLLEEHDERVVEIGLPDPIAIRGRVKIAHREPDHVFIYGEGRVTYITTKPDGVFDLDGLPAGRSQRVYFKLRDGSLFTRSIDAETARIDVDLGTVELTVPSDPTHEINLSFRFPEPRSESEHARLPGVTLVRTDGKVMYALRSLMDGQSYPLIKGQDRVIAGTYYLYPSWSFQFFPELEALVDAVLNGEDLSGYNLPTITVDENFKPQEIDVAECVKRFEPLLEAYRRKRIEDQPVEIKVVPRDGNSSE